MTISRRTGLLGALGGVLGALTGCSTTTPAPSPSAPATTASPRPSAKPSTAASPTPTPTPTPTARPTKPTPAGPTIPAVASPLRSGVVTAVIVGTDGYRNVSNTDVMVVAQLSADRSRLTLVSIPRDCKVRIPGYGYARVNSALAKGGWDTFKATISGLFGGLQIDYIAQTNFRDFIELSDLMRGYTVKNKVASRIVHSSGEVTRFPAGMISRPGDTMLYYNRQRKGLPRGDLDRGERHRATITGMIAYLQKLVVSDPARFMKIASGAFDHVNTFGGLNRSNVLGLVGALKAIRTAEVVSLRVPITGFGSNDYLLVDDDRLGELAAGLRRGDVSAYVRAHGTN